MCAFVCAYTCDERVCVCVYANLHASVSIKVYNSHNINAELVSLSDVAHANGYWCVYMRLCVRLARIDRTHAHACNASGQSEMIAAACVFAHMQTRLMYAKKKFY